MPPAKGPIWDHFLSGEKQNGSHVHAHCRDDEQLRRVTRRQAYTEEARLMEILADEEEDEERIPDAGELEGSGYDFDG